MENISIYEPNLSEVYSQILEISNNEIILAHGSIDLYVEDATYYRETKVQWVVTYTRPEFDYYKYKETLSLKEAFDVYLKFDLNARGM